MPRMTRAIVAAAVAGGAFTLFVAGWRQPDSGQISASQWIVAAAMGAMAMGSWVWPVVVFRGGESETIQMDEGFFVILALLVPPLLTLGTLALATVLAQAARRRTVVKSAFNAGQVLIAAGLGLAVSRGIAAPSPSLAAGQIAAVTLGVGVYIGVNMLLVDWKRTRGCASRRCWRPSCGRYGGCCAARRRRSHRTTPAPASSRRR